MSRTLFLRAMQPARQRRGKKKRKDKEEGEKRNRERIHDVDYWLTSFLKSISEVVEEDGEEVLPTQMQPLTLAHFDSYLGK